jgi:putative spermidine/putrescine transport system permease protein
MVTASDSVLRTADGVPLKRSLRRATSRRRVRTFMLVLPILAFLSVTFVMPVVDMLFRSVDNQIVSSVLPRTTIAIQSWDPASENLPEDFVFEAIVLDIQAAFKNKRLGRAGRRLNFEKTGMTSLFRKSGRRVKNITEPPFRDQLIEVDRRWAELDTWTLIRRESGTTTESYFLSAADLTFDESGGISWKAEERRIYLFLFYRTMWMSALITVFCLVLGYPVAYLLATLPVRQSNLLLILVLLPFWTSLLVRTTAWIALLQSEGVLNDIMVFIGVVSDDGRFQLIHNKFGTFVAMTHILLPFMILPLYSVMKTIPPSYMRAARSLGAPPLIGFLRVYMPNTVPGIGAGCILVFILSIGYYITPSLVGGQTGTFISNFIALHISETLNWGLAAALGVILLAVVLFLYFLYDRIVGVSNMKLG